VPFIPRLNTEHAFDSIGMDNALAFIPHIFRAGMNDGVVVGDELGRAAI
jgi:hypothetical protein